MIAEVLLPHHHVICYSFRCHKLLVCDGNRQLVFMGIAVLHLQVHYILQEVVMGGMVLETNMNEIVAQVEVQNRMEKSEVSIYNYWAVFASNWQRVLAVTVALLYNDMFFLIFIKGSNMQMK